MDCDTAQRTVLLNVADASLVQEAQSHIQHCVVCGGVSSHQTSEVEIEVQRRSQRSLLGRAFLAALGGLQLALATPWLFGSSPFWNSSGDTADIHLARDGALGMVFALVALSVAFSPRLAVFALPVTFVLLLIQTAMGIFDHSQQHVHVGFESVHILGALIAVGIAILARPKRMRRIEKSA
jgi:hypothetical protein